MVYKTCSQCVACDETDAIFIDEVQQQQKQQQQLNVVAGDDVWRVACAMWCALMICDASRATKLMPCM